MRPLLLFLLLVLLSAALLWLAVPREAMAQQPALVTLAQAYTAAWNAHHVDAVPGFLAPDAIVRHRGEDVPEAVWNAQDEAALTARWPATS